MYSIMFTCRLLPFLLMNLLKLTHLGRDKSGRHFPDIFKCISLNENVWILIKIPLKFVPKGLINNIPALVQIMAWRRPGAKPLSEPILVSLLTHICPTWSQWVKLISMMSYGVSLGKWVNTLRPRQNGRHFADDIFKWIFLNENAWISIKISLEFVPKVPIDNIPALVR